MSGGVLAILGLGLGALIVAGGRADARAPRVTVTSLRDRAIEAQQISARASQHARELAAQWSTEGDHQ